ncbi:SLC13 family permease [Staphylothermus marinus]|uniref:SLC13 family permease n=1 Tax=Staphylothermus marinus TaxID=2280 RepID=UPI00069BDA5D|nr:ArsB/NhaD family transporter [Staphylothermus marinus]
MISVYPLIGALILILLYTLLTLEIAHRTVVALIVAGLVMILNIFLHFTSFRELIDSIDIDTILLLMSMMIMVSVLSETGFFNYLSSKILGKYFSKPYTLVVVLTGATALISAFIDNVTTVLIISPIVIEITEKLRVDPRPLLIMIVFASNIGGTATLIGDPPNILIGSHADLGFMDFIYNVAPAIILVFLAFIIVVRFLSRDWFHDFYSKVKRVSLGEVSYIAYIDKKQAEKVILPFLSVISLFTLEDVLGYPPAVPALIGVALLFILVGRRINIEEVLHRVDWTTLVFFAAMFMTIKGIEKLGLMHEIATGILSFSGSYIVLMLMILWISAITSAFIDNIPFVMTMLPVLDEILVHLNYNATPLYWALSLGSCLGGNGTLIGASANVVVAGISERHGYPVSFSGFLKYGMTVMILSIIVSSIYLILRYG